MNAVSRKSNSSANGLRLAAGLIMAIIVVAGLRFTDPSKDDFRQYVQARVERKLQDDARKRDPNGDTASNPLQALGVSMARGIAGVAVDHSTVHRDYWLFGTFDVDGTLLRLSGSDVGDMKFLGIAGTFVPLSQHKPDDR